MTLSKPMREPGVTSRTIGNETMLSKGTDEAIHILNPTARLVWDLCDGQHTPEDIEKKMRASFSVLADYRVIDDIQKILEILRKKGLLKESVSD